MQVTLQTPKQVFMDYRAKLDVAMDEYFKNIAPQIVINLQGPEQQALDLLREFSQRPSKRVRGALALFAYDHFSKGQNSSAINLGVAIELVQNYLLIIDDVMDNSATRRSKPSIHKIIELDNEISPKLAEMLAVDVGLLSQHMASLLISEIEEQPEYINYATQLLHKNMIATAYGQFDDLFININLPDEASLIRTHELKSSYYTFINPLQVGAALSGITDVKVMEGILKIGLLAGVAFQLQDDLLGLFGNQNITGKPVVDDLKRGKYTLLMLYTFKLASAKDIEFLKSVLGNTNITASMHTRVKEIVERCGAKEQVENKAQAYCEKALMQIKLSGFLDDNAKQFLTEIINYSVNREA